MGSLGHRICRHGWTQRTPSRTVSVSKWLTKGQNHSWITIKHTATTATAARTNATKYPTKNSFWPWNGSMTGLLTPCPCIQAVALHPNWGRSPHGPCPLGCPPTCQRCELHQQNQHHLCPAFIIMHEESVHNLQCLCTHNSLMPTWNLQMQSNVADHWDLNH